MRSWFRLYVLSISYSKLKSTYIQYKPNSIRLILRIRCNRFGFYFVYVRCREEGATRLGNLRPVHRMDQWRRRLSQLQLDGGAVHHKDSRQPPVQPLGKWQSEAALQGRNWCVIYKQQPQRSLWVCTIHVRDCCLSSQQFSKSILVYPSATGLPCDLTITSEVPLSLFFRGKSLSNFRGHFRFCFNFRQSTRMSSVGDITIQCTQSIEK